MTNFKFFLNVLPFASPPLRLIHTQMVTDQRKKEESKYERKAVPAHAMKAYEVHVHSFLNSALGRSWLVTFTLRPLYYPYRTPVPLKRRLGGHQSWSRRFLRKEKRLHCQESKAEPSSPQPSHCTDWAIPAHEPAESLFNSQVMWFHVQVDSSDAWGLHNVLVLSFRNRAVPVFRQDAF
jgi:hypothetical protein